MNELRSPLIWIPAIVISVLIGGYTIYWFSLKQDVLDGVADWAEDRRTDGMSVSYDDATVSGFPSSMTLVIRTLTISDPQHRNEWSWTGETVNVILNPFRLTDVNAHFLGEHQFSYVDGANKVAGNRNELKSTADTARVALTLGRDKVKEIYTEIDGWRGQFRAAANKDFEPVSAKKYRMQMVAAPQDPTGPSVTQTTDTLDNQNMLFQLESLTLPPGTFPPLGDEITLVEAKTELRNLPADFQRADDRDDALRRWAEKDGSLNIDALHILWGDLDLTAEGDISLDRRYRPQGAITTLAGGYGGLIDGLAEQGQLDETLASLIKSALNLLALTGRDPKGRLNVPLDMRNGKLYLGPLQLTKLPPLVSEKD